MADNAHSVGHRARLRGRFKKGGLSGFASHEVLELLLTLAIPRKDVKTPAKLLLARFGNLKNVLEAPPDEVRAVPGIGSVAPIALAIIREAAGLYVQQTAEVSGDLGQLPSWEEYFDFNRHFGARTYGPSGLRRPPISRFDQKQIRFLQPFGAIDFVEQQTQEDRWTNLERVVDHKLQMELVPYGSANFSTTAFHPALLRDHFDRLLSVLSAVPRDYIFFCGQVFEPLLKQHIVEEHQFNLVKSDGSFERNRSRFANVLIPYEGVPITAGLAHSWPRQGIPMGSYAKECLKRYQH